MYKEVRQITALLQKNLKYYKKKKSEEGLKAVYVTTYLEYSGQGRPFSTTRLQQDHMSVSWELGHADLSSRSGTGRRDGAVNIVQIPCQRIGPPPPQESIFLGQQRMPTCGRHLAHPH